MFAGELSSLLLSVTRSAAQLHLMPTQFVVGKLCDLIGCSPRLPESGKSHESWQVLQGQAAVQAILLYGPVLLFSGLRSGQNRPDLKYRNRYDLDSLIRMQAECWRPLHAILPHGQQRKSSGSFWPRCSESSIAFEEWLDRKSLLPSAGSRLSLSAVNDALATEIGPVWRGPHSLQPYLRVLVGAFVLFHDNRRKASHDLFAALALSARCCHGTGMNRAVAHCLPLAERIIDSDAGRRLIAHADRHFWQRPAVMSMLEAAREGRGVLACASFVWLERFDRPLWIALNCLGNRVAMIEAAVAHAHYLAETQLATPLAVPATRLLASTIVDDFHRAANAMPRIRSRAQ